MSASTNEAQKGAIPKAVLEREHRQLRRHMASLIVAAMSKTDLDFARIGKRCGRNPHAVREHLHRLIEGNDIPNDIHYLSDVLLAMGYEPSLNVVPMSAYAHSNEARTK